jgi:flavorubredoxin
VIERPRPSLQEPRGHAAGLLLVRPRPDRLPPRRSCVILACVTSSTQQPFQPTVAEIAEGIYRISTLVPDVGPDGFTFNQFLVVGDETLLFHCGQRQLFPLVAEAVATVVPVESLRWLSFGHVEADEAGAMNMWLDAAPHAEVTFGTLGCEVSLKDMCDRPPIALQEGEVIDLGGKRLRQISTPHVPHGWEAQVLYEEVTGTLLCGDLMTQTGGGPALSEADPLEAALQAEAMFHFTALAPHTAAVLHQLADLAPTTLAIMHGPSFAGDGAAVLHRAADAYAALLAPA